MTKNVTGKTVMSKLQTRAQTAHMDGHCKVAAMDRIFNRLCLLHKSFYHKSAILLFANFTDFPQWGDCVCRCHVFCIHWKQTTRGIFKRIGHLFKCSNERFSISLEGSLSWRIIFVMSMWPFLRKWDSATFSNSAIMQATSGSAIIQRLRAS